MKIEVRGTCGPITIHNGITASGQNMRTFETDTEVSPTVWIDDRKVWPIAEKKPEPPKLERKPIVFQGADGSLRSFLPSLITSDWQYSEVDHTSTKNAEMVNCTWATQKVDDFTRRGWKRLL